MRGQTKNPRKVPSRVMVKLGLAYPVQLSISYCKTLLLAGNKLMSASV